MPRFLKILKEISELTTTAPDRLDLFPRVQIYRLELFPQPAATKSLADRDVTSNPLEVSAETTQSGKRKASACRLSVCPVIFSR